MRSELRSRRSRRTEWVSDSRRSLASVAGRQSATDGVAADVADVEVDVDVVAAGAAAMGMYPS
jgi:hypothetical protein